MKTSHRLQLVCDASIFIKDVSPRYQRKYFIHFMTTSIIRQSLATYNNKNLSSYSHFQAEFDTNEVREVFDCELVVLRHNIYLALVTKKKDYIYYHNFDVIHASKNSTRKVEKYLLLEIKLIQKIY